MRDPLGPGGGGGGDGGFKMARVKVAGRQEGGRGQ